MSACIQIGRKDRHFEPSSAFSRFGSGEGNIKRHGLHVYLLKTINRFGKTFLPGAFIKVIRIDNGPRALKPLLRPLNALGNLAQRFLYKGFQIHHDTPFFGFNGHKGHEMSSTGATA